MKTIEDIKSFTLRELLALTDTYFHIGGEKWFDDSQYIDISFDKLLVSDFDLSEDMPRLEVSTPATKVTDSKSHHISTGSFNVSLGLDLDLEYELDVDLYMNALDGTPVTDVPYTRDDMSIFIVNKKLVEVVEAYCIAEL